MATDDKRAPSRLKRWLEKLRLRNDQARDISHRVATARRQQPGRTHGGGDGPGVGGF